MNNDMLPKQDRKIKVPTDRDIKCYSQIEKWGEKIHEMDANNYSEASILLSSDDCGQLHEAVLVTENFLSYNGSWDFRRIDNSSENQYACEIQFKCNGFASTYGNITKKLKLPSGVKMELRF